MASGSCKLRLVRDTRVSAFTYRTAKQYLKKHNKISCYCPFTKYVWEIMQETPKQELVQAYEDIAMAEAFGAEERYLAFSVK
jgi:hypothetical protein